jgi:hypothetical protein
LDIFHGTIFSTVSSALWRVMKQEPSLWLTYSILGILIAGIVVFFISLGVHSFALSVVGAVLAILGFVSQIVLMMR